MKYTAFYVTAGEVKHAGSGAWSFKRSALEAVAFVIADSHAQAKAAAEFSPPKAFARPVEVVVNPHLFTHAVKYAHLNPVGIDARNMAPVAEARPAPRTAAPTGVTRPAASLADILGVPLPR